MLDLGSGVDASLFPGGSEREGEREKRLMSEDLQKEEIRKFSPIIFLVFFFVRSLLVLLLLYVANVPSVERGVGQSWATAVHAQAPPRMASTERTRGW